MACDRFTGACFPGQDLLHVGPGQRFTSLGDAIASVPPLTKGKEPQSNRTIIVHQGDYNEAVVVDGGRTLAFIAPPGDIVGWRAPTTVSDPQLTVTDATVLIDRLRLTDHGTADPAIDVTGETARLWVDRSRVTGNSGGGIRASNGAELYLVNSFVGGSISQADAVEVNDAHAEILYSTLGAGYTNATALRCAGSADVEVRNSILVSRGGVPSDEIACDGAIISRSAGEGMPPGGTNSAVGEFPADSPEDWFVDYNGGDFRLSGEGPTVFGGLASWLNGDPVVDIDADVRIGRNGADEHAGADIP